MRSDQERLYSEILDQNKLVKKEIIKKKTYTFVPTPGKRRCSNLLSLRHTWSTQRVPGQLRLLCKKFTQKIACARAQTHTHTQM